MFDEWEMPAELPKLTASEVQIWRIDLADEMMPEEEYLRLLTVEEAERAGRLRAGQVRMQFLSGRSCLRRLLARELDLAPAEVPIVTGKFGKPEIAPEIRETIHFNVAHSRSTVLLALSRIGQIGIDIEYLDRSTDVMEVSRHSLTSRERSLLLSIDDISSRNKAFFECWTRKEAIVKADGRGLSLPLTAFEVPVGAPCQALGVTVPGKDGRHQLYFVSDVMEDTKACTIAIAMADQPAKTRLLTVKPSHSNL